MKICFISPKSYPLFNQQIKSAFGGAETQIYLLTKELAKNTNFDIHVIAGDYEQPKTEIRDNVTIHCNINKKRMGGALSVLPMINKFFLFYLLKKINADIYVQRAAGVITGLLSFYCKIFNKKFIYMVACEADTDEKITTLLGKLKTPIYRYGIKNAALVICQTQEQSNNLLKNFKKTSIVIPSPVYSIKKNERGLSSNNVLWVGRVNWIKRPELFITLAQNNPHLNFTMICQSSQEQKYDIRINNLAKQTSNLTFIKYVPFDMVDAFFQKAIALVNTSDFEGFPNTFIQAAKNKTPILSLNSNPDGFITKSQCGFCTNGNFDKLNQYLNLLIDNKQLREKYAQNAYNYAKKNHDIEKGIEQLKQAISNLFKKRTTFNFGTNWMNYSVNSLDIHKFSEAKLSLINLIGRKELLNKSFIDIGCGSGIFSLAAKSLGAKMVIGTDISPESIAAAEMNKKKIKINDVYFQEADILDKSYDFGKFDIVYSWGVLHHTGQMWKAIDNAIDIIADGGFFVISIYNKHWTSPFWQKIKYFYNIAPTSIQNIMIGLIFLKKCISGIKNLKQQKKRGMSFYYDVVDWTGGYPYEYADKNAVVKFCIRRGLKLLKINPNSGTGCNEFVFKK